MTQICKGKRGKNGGLALEGEMACKAVKMAMVVERVGPCLSISFDHLLTSVTGDNSSMHRFCDRNGSMRQ